jgi:hypothetical protein
MLNLPVYEKSLRVQTVTRTTTGIALASALILLSLSTQAAGETPGADSARQLAMELGAPFCDNMVLQRDMKVLIGSLT